MSDTVLVTGGFGLVGIGNRTAAGCLGRPRGGSRPRDARQRQGRTRSCRSGVEFRWTDLTDAEQVQRLVSETAPSAIIHLAAIIAPAIYRIPKVARRVNVDATTTLVRIAEAQPNPPRFVHASSNAVFGPRNPHRTPHR